MLDRAAPADSDSMIYREWEHFVYKPKTINFSCETVIGQEKDVFDGINLPQFSSAAVPKMENLPDETKNLHSDFVLHAGGLVWAMDWCPRNLESSDDNYKREYLAVAAHPPSSTYHKIGVPLRGRGIIQIWCLLSLEESIEISPLRQRKPKGNPTARPRGNPKDRSKGSNNNKQCFSAEEEEIPSYSLIEKEEVTVQRPRGRPKGSFKKRPHSTVTSLNESFGISTRELVLSNCDFSDAIGNEVEKLVPKCRGTPSVHPSLNPHEQVAACETILAPILADFNSNVVSNQPKRRGRPKKKPNRNAIECVQEFGRDPRKDEIGLLTFGEHVTLAENIMLPKHKGRPSEHPSLNPDEQISASETILAPISVELNSNIVSNQPKRRGRPKKKPDTNAIERVQEFGADPREDEIGLLTFGDRETLAENTILLKRSGRPKKSRSEGANKLVRTSVSILEEHLTANREIVPITSAAQHISFPALEVGECSLSSCKINAVSSTQAGANGKMDSVLPMQHLRMQQISSKGKHLLGSATESGASIEHRTVEERCLWDEACGTELCEGADIRSVETRSSAVICVQNETKGRISREVCESLERYTSGKMQDSTTCRKKRRLKDREGKPNALATTMVQTDKDHCLGETVLSNQTSHENFQIPKESALPKVVFCLSHMGSVAWDVKWRPVNINESEEKHRLGYLAALLGNGSLEVWEIPHPNVVKNLHTSCNSNGTNPRFLKLRPVFKCSEVMCGDRQSIPLTLEWSPSAPYDLILAGCHDGTVALWKFSKQSSSQDTKPVLCFSADNVPIRSLAWAPDGSDAESANLIVTAGHEGLKFWDIRDPYRPLWEYTPVQRIILSLQWLQNPRCLIMSYDDGVLRILSLWKVANDSLVNGEPFDLTKQIGLHNWPCSPFAIWSFQVSRATDIAAYCTADGNTRFFKFTANAVEKDSSRYHEPHFLCGSFTSDGSKFEIRTPLPKVPLPNLPSKKIPKEMGDAPLYSHLQESNQARGRADKSKSRCSNQKSDSERQVEEGTIQPFDNQEDKHEMTFEELPPKEVAIHKVRWNMNKGSEKWLCYGGAAGIVRCQKIS